MGPFDGTQDTWDERLGFFFQANGIGNDAKRKKAILLSVCGASTYKLIRSLPALTAPEEAEYDVIMKMEYTNPKPSKRPKRAESNRRRVSATAVWGGIPPAAISKRCNATSVRKLATSPGPIQWQAASHTETSGPDEIDHKGKGNTPCGGPIESIR